MRRHLLATTFLALGGAFFATPAVAQGPPIENSTQHIVNVTDTDVGVHPCTGEPAQFTIVQSGVIHFVALADGTVHITGTLRGTLSIDLLPAHGTPDATGTFTSWFGGNGLLNEDGSVSGKAQSAFTFNGRGTNADGSTFSFHQSGNTVFDPNGVPKLDVFHERTHCG
jgi:hypothetical protein